MIVRPDDAHATVVITTRNRAEDLMKALSSCQEQTEAVEVIVIDDASTDDTVARVRGGYPQATLVSNPEPRGYIVGRNHAARIAQTDYLFSIDDDAVYTDPATIEKALTYFDDPRIAALSLPFINLTGEPSTQSPPDSTGTWVTYAFVGTAYAVRRSALLELGGYEEDFFHQGEEIDFCERLLATGRVVRLVDTPPIIHAQTSAARDWKRVDVYGRRNDVLIGWRNAPFPELFAYWSRAVARGLLIGVRVRRVRNMLSGFREGIRACLAHRRSRRPLARPIWRLSRQLRRSGPMPLAEAATVLPAVAPARAPRSLSRPGDLAH